MIKYPKEIIIQLSDKEFFDDAQLLARSFFAECVSDCKVKLSTDISTDINTNDNSKEQQNKDICFISADVFLPDVDEKKGTRGQVHDIFKRNMYDALVRRTGKTLPWGFLTGVRPAKRAMELIKKYEYLNDKDELKKSVINDFSKIYHTSNSKAKLAFEVAVQEKNILAEAGISQSKKSPEENGFSLYVGIPFCPSVCRYCSFSSMPVDIAGEELIEKYLYALFLEIERTVDILKERYKENDLKPASIYIGGGTPTALSESQLERLLSCLKNNFTFTEKVEFTVEAGRPDSITKEKLNVLKNHNVKRISVNPQTMNDDTLEIIGRKHSAYSVRQAFSLARESGFDNINMDIILGLPGEGEREVKHTAREIFKLKPDSLTVHSLAIKRAAQLNIDADSFSGYRMENNDKLLEITENLARSLELFPYYMYRQQNMAGNFENTGYAKRGFESLYNIVIMEEVQDIIAFGAGASSKLMMGNGRFERAINVKSVNDYIDRVDEMVLRKEKLIIS